MGIRHKGGLAALSAAAVLMAACGGAGDSVPSEEQQEVTSDTDTVPESSVATETNTVPEFSSGHTASLSENQLAVMTVSASDPQGGNILYSLSGAEDDALFTIDAVTGELSFLAAPDYEAPTDQDADNSYRLEVTASDGNGQAVQSITVAVTDEDEAPAFSKAINSGATDVFGSSVALSDSGETLAVGASLEAGAGTGLNPTSDNNLSGSGAAYLY